jgi:hypothetical protein
MEIEIMKKDIGMNWEMVKLGDVLTCGLCFVIFSWLISTILNLSLLDV